MDQDLESLIDHMGKARTALWKVVESASNDPRLVMLGRDVTALWHILVAADFTVLRVREKWENFKQHQQNP